MAGQNWFNGILGGGNQGNQGNQQPFQINPWGYQGGAKVDLNQLYAQQNQPGPARQIADDINSAWNMNQYANLAVAPYRAQERMNAANNQTQLGLSRQGNDNRLQIVSALLPLLMSAMGSGSGGGFGGFKTDFNSGVTVK